MAFEITLEIALEMSLEIAPRLPRDRSGAAICRCAVGQLRVSLARADDGRVRRYAAVRGPSATAQSLLRVETLHEQRGGLAIWLGACHFLDTS